MKKEGIREETCRTGGRSCGEKRLPLKQGAEKGGGMKSLVDHRSMESSVRESLRGRKKSVCPLPGSLSVGDRQQQGEAPQKKKSASKKSVARKLTPSARRRRHRCKKKSNTASYGKKNPSTFRTTKGMSPTLGCDPRGKRKKWIYSAGEESLSTKGNIEIRETDIPTQKKEREKRGFQEPNP